MTTTLKRCLIIDDDESFRQLITRHINLILPDVIVEEYDPAVSGPPPTDFDWTGCDLVILDYFLNSSQTGLDLLNEWKKQKNFPPVIMMTAAGSEEVAVRAMKTGVQDYLRKQNITREKLKQAIVDAIDSRAKERERLAANTHSSQSFNKSLFYKKLEQAASVAEPQQVFVLMELDQFDELGEQHGVILQDNLIRHIAKAAYAGYEDDQFATSITRMSDETIGLLFTLPAETSLESELRKLKKRLDSSSFEHDGQPLSFTLSIGAVALAKSGNKANDIIRNARALCKRVRDKGGNGLSVHIPGQSPDQSRAPANSEAQAAATPHDNRKTSPQAGPKAAVEQPASMKYAAQKAANDKPAHKVNDQPAAGSNRPAAAQSPSKASKPAPPSEEDLLEMTLEMPAEKLQGQPADKDAANTGDFDILQAFRDNRLLQYYQPIMPLSDAANQIEQEYYSIRIRMVDTNGSIIEADKIIPELRESRNQRLLDRWLLRQTIGRIVSFHNNKQQGPVFLIKLSEESFADANLFNWLQTKLMKPLGNLDVGQSLYIEVSAETYLGRQKQVEALFKFLRQSYGFRFALSSFDDIEQLNSCVDKGKFDMFKINQKLLGEIQSKQSDPTAMPQLVSSLKQRGCLLVSTFIEDAGMLTQAINCGADFAMGYFIGEPFDNINEAAQIESFEIT